MEDIFSKTLNMVHRILKNENFRKKLKEELFETLEAP